MNYTDLVDTIVSEATQVGDTAFAAILPVLIQNAQLRIYREVRFLSQRGVSQGATTVNGTRSVSLSAIAVLTINGYTVDPAYPMIVESMNLVVSSARVPFVRSSLDYVNSVWPEYGTTATPGSVQGYYAMQDDQTVVMMPTPNGAYPVEVIGTWRPELMSATQGTTWLGDNLPDLLLAACMVEAFIQMRDIGGYSDDPKIAMSWATRYGEARESAIAEDAARRAA